MKLWEDEIFGKVRNEDWLAIGSQVPTRPNDPIDALLGDDKTDNIVAKWESLANEFQIPVMAQFHGFDTEAQTTFRMPIDTHSIEKGLIKVKINQSERLRTLNRSGVQGDQALYNYVMDDGIRLADQVITRTKVAKNELLATGKVTIKENNLDLTVDYGVPEDQLGFVIDFTDDAEKDVPSQIQDIIDVALAKGVTLTGFVTSSKMINKMRANKAIQKEINGIYGAGALVKRSELYAYLADEFGLTNIVLTDLTYGLFDGFDANGRPKVVSHRYFPQNTISFFSSNLAGKLGTGLWGNPPEVDMTGFYKINTSNLDPYVYITQKMEWDPAVLWTKASGLFMPVLYNPNSLFIAQGVDGDIDTPKVKALKDSDVVYGTTVSDMASNILVGSNEISGTLKYLSTGQLVSDWGAGNFLPITFDASDWSKYTSVKVGLQPSAGAGMQELIGHLDDLDSAFKITDKNSQKLVIVAKDKDSEKTLSYDLSGLTLQPQGA